MPGLIDLHTARLQFRRRDAGPGQVLHARRRHPGSAALCELRHHVGRLARHGSEAAGLRNTRRAAQGTPEGGAHLHSGPRLYGERRIPDQQGQRPRHSLRAQYAGGSGRANGRARGGASRRRQDLGGRSVRRFQEDADRDFAADHRRRAQTRHQGDRARLLFERCQAAGCRGSRRLRPQRARPGRGRRAHSVDEEARHLGYSHALS